MKKKRLAIILFLLTIFSLLFFTGCPSPMNPVDLDGADVQQPSVSNSEEASAYSSIITGVSLSIPRYAPWIGTQPVSRAYGFTDNVEITVYDSGSTVIYNDTFEPTYDSNHQIECDIVLAPGTGYTVDIDIYNLTMSNTEPVVSGSSASFDISDGVVTQVPVICIPNNPIVSAADTVYDFSGLTAVLDLSGNPTGSSTEFWYQMTAPASGYFNVDIVIPADIIFYYGAFNADGTAVISFGSAAGGPGSETLPFSVTPGEVYYFGLVYAGDEAETINGSVSWTEVNPNFLTDEDVPDPILRQLLESYTGKRFTILGEAAPASPISDADLSSLNSLRCDGGDGAVAATGITNLTGLSYCTSISYLGLGGNDFSGADANFQELSSLVDLRSFDIGGSNLQNLDFLDYLVNPNFRQITFPDNPDLSLSDILNITSTRFPNLQDLGFNDYDTTGDSVADPISAADWSAIVDQLALFEHLGELRSGELSLTNDMFNEFITEVVNIRPDNWGWIYLSGSEISDISGLTGLANLYCLEISNTDITDLAPLQLLYNDGAFHNPESWMEHDIDIRYCDLDLWEGTDNRAVVDYLISEGVRVNYEDGNDLVEPVAPNDWEYSGGYTVSGTIDFSAMADRDEVDYISLWINDSSYTRNIGYVLDNSEFLSFEVDYSYINLEPNEQYYMSFSLRDTEGNEIGSKHIPLNSDVTLTQDVIIRDPNDWGYTGGYTVSGTIDISALTDRDSVEQVYFYVYDSGNTGNINYSISSDDFTGYTIDYSIVNFEPDLEYNFSIQVQGAQNRCIVSEQMALQLTESAVHDVVFIDPNDWNYSGGGTLSGTVDFSYLSFADDVDTLGISLYDNGSGDSIFYDIPSDDFVGNTAYYEFVNLDPALTDYSISANAYCYNTGVNANTSQSSLQVPITGLELDLEIREPNDWGCDGGGTLSGTIDFSGISFASTVDSIQIGLSDNSTGTLISKYINLHSDDFSGSTAAYDFINTDPAITSYQLSLYVSSGSTAQNTNNYFTSIQVAAGGLTYDLTAGE